jgi:DNA-binding NarL/FixJ family response regulator
MKRAPVNKKAEVARLYAAGWQPEVIAQRLRVEPRTIYTYATTMRRSGADLPRAPATHGFDRRLNYAEVARLWNAGEKQGAIAARLGFTQSGISAALHAMAGSGMLTRPLGRWPRQAA